MKVVVAEGTNPSGKTFLVHRLYTPRPPLPAQLPIHYSPSTRLPNTPAIRLLLACGPLTSSENLDYRPMHELAKRVIVERPHVLLLIGPVVDAKHPLIETLAESTFDDLFAHKMQMVAKVCERHALSLSLSLTGSRARSDLRGSGSSRRSKMSSVHFTFL